MDLPVVEDRLTQSSPPFFQQPAAYSGAATEIQGALVFARASPRDAEQATKAVRAACASPTLAERAFFRQTRDGRRISAPSLRLATEIARC